MTEIKRPNYFTSQFLVEKDFNDEQAYHLDMRRRLNRVLHTFGVADGFEVTRASTTEVRVGVGTAIDKDGREIVLADPVTYALTTHGSDLDVYLTIAYQDVPTDHYNQAGIDKFTRTAERPVLQDGAAVPPADGSVIVLARIRLSASATIESDGSIDPSVRTRAGARITPHSIGVDELTQDAVTVERLDTLGGPNRLVTQINAGTGVIAGARVERTTATGTVTFTNLALNQEQFSDEIDPGLADGPLSIELAFDDTAQPNLTLAGDVGYARSVSVRSVLNRSTGRFRIFAMRTQAGTGAVRVRWYALKLPSGPDNTVEVGVTVSPPQINVAGNTTQVFTATVKNATATGVTWAGPGPDGGTLVVNNATTATYTSGVKSGNFQVTATSTADTSKSATANINVTAAIAVNLSQLSANLITRTQLTLSASVINTPNTGITWSIENNAGGTLSTTSGASTTFTAPASPGTFTVVATSIADKNAFAKCVITVSAVSISVRADTNPIPGTGSTVVRATITPSFVDQNADWTLTGAGQITTTRGPTTTYIAPGLGGRFTVTGTSVADPTKSDSVDINANPVGPGPGPGPGPGGPGPGGPPILPKLAASVEDQAAAAQTTKASTKPRTLVGPRPGVKSK
ncbi:MAG TPA: hypothetical protein VFS52_18800 [Steroidobacteraceae bacterium]|nr:hypothetical protein [Steroidobacteraceae bacterium]